MFTFYVYHDIISSQTSIQGASKMNFEEENLTLDAFEDTINKLEMAINTHLYTKEEISLQKRCHMLPDIRCSMRENENLNDFHDLMHQIKSYERKAKTLLNSYFEHLEILSAIKYKMLERMEVLKELMVLCQNDDVHFPEIIEKMDTRFKKHETWAKEFPKAFLDELTHKDIDNENAFKKAVFTQLSELSNDLNRGCHGFKETIVSMKGVDSPNYPSTTDMIKATRKLIQRITDIQLSLFTLEERLKA